MKQTLLKWWESFRDPIVYLFFTKKPRPRPKFGINDELSGNLTIADLKNQIISHAKIDFSKEKKHHSLSNVRFDSCSFNHTEIIGHRFQKCTFANCSFNGASIQDVEFDHCFFIECLFFKTKFQSTYLDPSTLHFSWIWYWFMPNVNAGFFQALYRLSKDTHQDAFAMVADQKFQFYRRYQHLRSKNNKSYFRFLRGLAFDVLLGYGYGIWNTLAVTALMIGTFACFITNRTNIGEGYLHALYYSVVSFTGVGYGDITPKLDATALFFTMTFLLASIAWCAVVTAIIVKRIVR